MSYIVFLAASPFTGLFIDINDRETMFYHFLHKYIIKKQTFLQEKNLIELLNMGASKRKSQRSNFSKTMNILTNKTTKILVLILDSFLFCFAFCNSYYIDIPTKSQYLF